MMHSRTLALAFALLLATPSLACNGSPDLCSKPYNQLAYATTHNSFASGFNTAANQQFDIPTQLKDGIRGLMLDAHKPPAGKEANVIQLCHTSCDLLDAGSAGNTLKNIKTFLQANPQEVVTIFWENFDKFPASTFAQVYQSAGVMDMVYSHTPGAPWPTLGDLVKQGKRIVNFIGDSTDDSQPWLIPEFEYVFETPFQVPSNDAFTCTVDRPAGTSPNGKMYLINHFIYSALTIGGQQVELPQQGQQNVTNGQVLVDHVNSCSQTFGRNANFIAVDWYTANDGQVLKLVSQLNGVPYVARALGSPMQGKKSAAAGLPNSFAALWTSLTLLALWSLAL
ncbi:uncharacterized protein VTP21DRAFT_7115 [Calcarisporiella thermophila]|uniref:uncharacterized protein n=1 Tax=Calcarisporiella thermophila TaxID=911321 RepID=UPI0037444692